MPSGNGSTYANGAVVSQSGSNTTTAGQTSSFTITNAYLWPLRQAQGDRRALQQTISNAQSGGTTTSNFTYNPVLSVCLGRQSKGPTTT